jgi:hypothetical protein
MKMYGMNMEICEYGECEAAEACESVCEDIGVVNIAAAAFGGILEAICISLPEGTQDIIGGDLSEVESIYKEWDDCVEKQSMVDGSMVDGSIDFVKEQVPDLENGDAIIAGSKIALGVAKEGIKKTGKAEQYAVKIDAAHEALEKVEKTKQMKIGGKKQKWWHLWKK